MFTLTRAQYEERWGTGYKRPGFGHKVLALFLRIVPRFGPFQTLAFRAPTPEAERLFLESFTTTVARYRVLLRDVSRNRLRLANRNFDTGQPVKAGDYRLVDRTYARLVEKLAKDGFRCTPDALRADVLRFYSDLRAPIAPRQDRRQWASVLRGLAALKQRAASSQSEPWTANLQPCH